MGERILYWVIFFMYKGFIIKIKLMYLYATFQLYFHHVLLNIRFIIYVSLKIISKILLQIISAPINKCKNEDDEDDVEALRLAALQTLRVKDTFPKKRHSPHQSRGGTFQGAQSLRPYYNQSRSEHFHHRQQRQNGVRHVSIIRGIIYITL